MSTQILVFIPIVMFLTLVAPDAVRNSLWILIAVAAALASVTMGALLSTGLKNPGIIPRNEPASVPDLYASTQLIVGPCIKVDVVCMLAWITKWSSYWSTTMLQFIMGTRGHSKDASCSLRQIQLHPCCKRRVHEPIAGEQRSTSFMATRSSPNIAPLAIYIGPLVAPTAQSAIIASKSSTTTALGLALASGVAITSHF